MLRVVDSGPRFQYSNEYSEFQMTFSR